MQQVIPKKVNRFIFQTIICALMYTILAQLSNWVTVTPEKLRIFWPAMPFAVFFISTMGYQASFGIWLGAFFYFWWTISEGTFYPDSVFAAGLASLVVTIQAFLGAFLLQRWIGDFPTKPQIKNLLKVIGVLALISGFTPASEFIAHQLSPMPHTKILNDSYLIWYLGACLTYLAILPVLMVIKMKLSQKQIGSWLPKIILGFGLVLSLILYLNSQGREKADLESQFASYSENVAMNIQQTLLRGYHEVGVLQRYFSSSSFVSRSEFAEFTTPFLFGEHHTPGLVSMIWIPHVPQEERLSFEAEARQEGETGFKFYDVSSDEQKIEAADRVEYYPVFYEHSSEDGQTMLGMDLMTAPGFQAKLENARDLGNGVLVDCAPFLESTGMDRRYLVLLPLYGHHESAETVQERRINFTGFVGAIFRLDEWIASSGEPGISISSDSYIFDEGAVSGQQLIYYSSANTGMDPVDIDPGLQPESLKNGIYAQHVLGGMDTEWLLIVNAAPDYVSRNRTNTPLLVLLLGILTTFSISIYATKNYKDMLALQDSQEKYMLLAENVNDVIWTFDMTDTRLLYVSPSVVKLCGYTADEIIEKSLTQVVSKTTVDYLEAALPDRMKKFYQENEYFYLDPIEVLHRDGRIIHAETSTNAFLNNKTNHIELYGVVRDITWRKQAEEKLRQRDALLQMTQKLS